jgi:enoyl-CoA hydratase/carnithine racemase
MKPNSGAARGLVARMDAGTGLRIHQDARGRSPAQGAEAFDLLLCEVPRPRPWVQVPAIDAALQAVHHTLAQSPRAAQAAMTLLRRAGTGRLQDALARESQVYSGLLFGPEFKAWRHRTPIRAPRQPPADPVQYTRVDDAVTLTLSDPARLNAWSTAMRDALADALDTCLLDPTLPQVTLRGAGRAFCSGGALDEFGSATDPRTAHRIRMRQSAVLRLASLGPRGRVVVHGPTVGSGVEMAAGVSHVEAHPDTTLHMPELAMGLIPGAGGTVTISRRIGRHRLAYWLLSRCTINAQLALEWGLVDAILPAGSGSKTGAPT